MTRTDNHYLLIGAVLAMFVLASPGAIVSAAAQTGDPELGATTWRTGPCKDCHGWAGDGVPEVSQFNGANIRESRMTPEAMLEVIKCGIPGTDMPSWRNNAWTEIIPCYGMTAPLEGPMQPNEGGRTFGDRAINGLVAFIFRDFVGKPVTKEYCHEVVGPESTRCDAYPTEAEAGAAN